MSLYIVTVSPNCFRHAPYVRLLSQRVLYAIEQQYSIYEHHDKEYKDKIFSLYTLFYCFHYFYTIL